MLNKKLGLLSLVFLLFSCSNSKPVSSSSSVSSALKSTSSNVASSSKEESTTSSSEVISSTHESISSEESSSSSSSSTSSSFSTISSSSTSSSSEDSVQPSLPTSWNSEEIQKMQDTLGYVLPFHVFTVEHNMTIENNGLQDIIFIYAENESPSFVSTYGTTLLEDGFELADTQGEDNPSYFYTKSLSDNTRLVAQVQYYLGSNIYAPEFEVYAWVEEINLGSTGEGWTSEDEYYMYILLGEPIPKPNYSKPYDLDTGSDETGPYIVIYCDNEKPEIVDSYKTTLEENGYLYYSESSKDYTKYKYRKEWGSKEHIVIQFGYFPGNAEYPTPCFEVFAWVE